MLPEGSRLTEPMAAVGILWKLPVLQRQAAADLTPATIALSFSQHGTAHSLGLDRQPVQFSRTEEEIPNITPKCGTSAHYSEGGGRNNNSWSETLLYQADNFPVGYQVCCCRGNTAALQPSSTFSLSFLKSSLHCFPEVLPINDLPSID